MSTAFSARCFSASLMDSDDGSSRVVRALLVEHLAQQTGISRIVFDQEKRFDRISGSSVRFSAAAT